MKLKTQKLLIRPFVLNDLNDMHEYCTQKEVAESAGWAVHRCLLTNDIPEKLEDFNEGTSMHKHQLVHISTPTTLNAAILRLILRNWHNGYYPAMLLDNAA